MDKAPIRDYMSVFPQRIAPEQSLYEAHKIMRENKIRHLPVIARGKLVGIISMGDLHLMETLKGVDPGSVVVEEAMTAKPYAVGPEETLASVARTMADNKYGSAIVVDEGLVVGVFTTNDALRALAELLERRAPPRSRGKR